MTAEQVFSVAGMLAMAGWLILLASPWTRRAADWISGIAIPLALAALYAGLVAANWAGSEGGFDSLAAVRALFTNDWLLLAGWVHYLAFDLFVGSWETRDARERGIPHGLVIPCLLLTFLFGPAGLLLYFALRTARARS
jgi:hypothetical protein